MCWCQSAACHLMPSPPLLLLPPVYLVFCLCVVRVCHTPLGIWTILSARDCGSRYVHTVQPLEPSVSRPFARLCLLVGPRALCRFTADSRGCADLITSISANVCLFPVPEVGDAKMDKLIFSLHSSVGIWLTHFRWHKHICKYRFWWGSEVFYEEVQGEVEFGLQTKFGNLSVCNFPESFVVYICFLGCVCLPSPLWV